MWRLLLVPVYFSPTPLTMRETRATGASGARGARHQARESHGGLRPPQIPRLLGRDQWLGWIALPIGVAALTPGAFVAFLVMMAWSLIVSALLYLRPEQSPQ